MVEESSEQSPGQGGDKASDDKKRDPAVERLQIYVGLVKFAIGTVALGTITLFLNEQYRNAQLALDREKSTHALELQDKRAEVEYLSKSVANAMDKDFKVRVDFADYMKSVALSKTLKEIWSKYYDILSQKQAETEQERAQLVVRKDDTARQLATIEFTKPNAPSTAELVKQLQGTYDQLYLVQEKLDRARYGTFQQNYFDFRQAAKDAAAAQQAGNYARERDLMLDAAGRVPREVKAVFPGEARQRLSSAA
jgi:uncharacterized membrane-anchored protein YhcB (DUF1043 family)